MDDECSQHGAALEDDRSYPEEFLQLGGIREVIDLSGQHEGPHEHVRILGARSEDGPDLRAT